MSSKKRRNVCLCVAIAGMVLLAAYEIFGMQDILFANADDGVRYLCSMTITRFLGGVIFLAMLINLGYRVLDPIKAPFWRSIAVSLPALLVAVNNFPFSQVMRGGAVIDAPAWKIILLLAECLCIGFFEEMAFRGVVLLRLIERKPQSKIWVFWSIVLSSVIFGLIHLINLYDSSPVAVLMQIGYSALIGAMCSVVLIKTANLWLCIVLHGVFDFGGAIVQYCGKGEIWDTFTVVLTAIIAVAVTIYMIVIFLRADLGIFDNVLGKKSVEDTVKIE